jgi:hypothetical protein
MIDEDLLKHRAEFARALRNKHYEETETGLFFPAQKVNVNGVYTHDVNGLDERSDGNIVVTEGMNYMLDLALNNGTKLFPFYLALFGGNVTPGATWTAANFAANSTEITSGTEGYTETVRQTFTPATASAGLSTNAASRGVFTFASATSVNVYGAGLLSSNVKGGTTGTLMSAAKFSAVRTLYNTDVFNVGYSLQLTST